MRASILAVLALVAIAVVSVSAQSTGAGPNVPTTICERVTAGQQLDWQTGAGQYAAMRILITRIALGTNTSTPANGLFISATTRDYFNGNIKYRNGTDQVTPSPFANVLPNGATPNFLVDTVSLDTLIQHLIQFFGAPLGCKSGTAGFPAYVSNQPGFGPFTQYQVHANMKIGAAVFSAFNNQVLSAAVSMGATPDDGAAVSGVLNTFGRNAVASPPVNMICTQADCPCATGVTGANCDNVNGVAALSSSFVTLAAAALVALFAMRR